MNLLFLSQIVPYPPHGGVLQRGYHVIRQLGARNEVDLLAFVHPDVLKTPAQIEESRVELGRFCRSVAYFPLWPKAVSPWLGRLGYAWSALTRSPFSVQAHRSAAFERAMRACVESRRIDLVHFDTLALARFAGVVPDLPRTLTHHNIESQLMARRAERETRRPARFYLAGQARKLGAYEARVCPAFDLNLVVSDADGDTLRGIVPGLRTETIANGVDIDYFTPQPDLEGSTGPALIYTGGMNMFANRDAVEYFLGEIWPRIRREVGDARFFAVGQDPPRELLEAAGRDPSIVVTGYVDDIRPLVARASVYVVPLRVGGGTRLKIVDAMAMGKAIVSTPIGAEGLHLTEGRDIVLAADPGRFADAVVALLRDASARRRLGAAARRRVEEAYAWDIVGARLQRACELAVAHAGQRRSPAQGAVAGGVH